VVKFSTQQAHAVAHRRVVHYLPGLEVRTTDDGEELHIICVPLARGSVRCLHWVKGKPGDIEADQVRYSVDDHLRSCSLELDKHAGVISHEGYYPYGGTAWWAARSKVDADYKTIRYSGKERDACGLYYYGFRYFSPWLGRWVSPDPAGSVDGLNLYCFCGNNPVCRTDSDGRMWGPADDEYVKEFFDFRVEYGAMPSSSPEPDDESMDYQDDLNSPDESSPGSADSPIPPPPPTDDQNTVLDILNANPDKPAHHWNDANLLERTSFGGKVYRADRRPPEEVLRDGFNATTEFTSIGKMLSNEALTVSETLEGVLFYAAQSQDDYYFYEIDADEVGGVSLLENLVLNTPRLRQHLNNPDPTYTLDDQTGLSNRMHEAHLNFDDLNDGKPRIKSLGRLPEEMKRARVTVNH
jgi:insecticidal toxin complex protein TccC